MEILVFHLDNRRCAVKLEDVHEVVAAVAYTPLPGAPDKVVGIINVRGQIAALLDIRQCFGQPSRPPQSSDHYILSHLDGRMVAICVDRVIARRTLSDSEREDARIFTQCAPYVTEIAKDNERFILICQVDKFLSQAETVALRAALDTLPPSQAPQR